MNTGNIKSGRVLLENGEYVNLGDLDYERNASNILLCIQQGIVFQAGWRGNIPANSTLTVAQPITSGSICGVSFGFSLIGGPVEYSIVAGATFGDILETIPGYNLDRRKLGTAGFDSINPLYRVDGRTGGIVIGPDFALTPATGAARLSLSISQTGLGGLYDGPSSPCVEFSNTTGQAVAFAFSWIWRETP